MPEEVIEVTTRYYLDDGVVTRIEHIVGGETFSVTPEDIIQAAGVYAKEALIRQANGMPELTEEERLMATSEEHITEHQANIINVMRQNYGPVTMLEQVQKFTNLVRLASEMREPIGDDETTPP